MKSIRTHLTIVLLLCILLPTGLIGTMTYTFLYHDIKKTRIDTVGKIAEKRHEALQLWLHEYQERSKNVLGILLAVCHHSDDGINNCAQTKLEQFAIINRAVGVSFHSGIENDLSVGVDAIPLANFDKPLLPEQLAITTNSKVNNAPIYSLIVTDSVSGFSLVTTYSAKTLQAIFINSPLLGQSGETFLVDNKGMFITQSRYPSTQGIVEPITAPPMLHCLQGESTTMLNLDYRNGSVVHGFQFVPEIGGGCIMAHIDQKEAFVPLMQLIMGLMFAAVFLACTAWFIARTLSKNMTKPIMALADMAKALSKGDFTQQTVSTNYQEIADLSQLFNSMAGQLNDTLNRLKASEQELEQKVIERTAQLQESESYQRAVFNATPDAMLISDKNGIITMANQQAERLLGYSISELLGLSIERLVPERYHATHLALRAEFAASPVTVARPMGIGRVVKVLCKNSELDVEVSLSPIKTEQGLFFASALRDIHERKQAESLLRASEKRFRQMADNTPVIIWITDTRGEPTFVNKSWLDFTGLDSLRTMSHENWISTIHPDDRETAFVGYYQNINLHESITTEYRLRNAKGEWRWILDQGLPLFDENGVFSGYIGSAIDITERKQVQQALQDKEQMLSESQRIAHIGSWSIELATGRISWSDETYRIFGILPEQFAHTTQALLDLIHSDDRLAMQNWINHCIAGKKCTELDFRILLADGSIAFLRCNGGLQTDEMHRPLRIIGSVQDISERKFTGQQINQLAFYDPLTELPNRRLLHEKLKHGINVERRDGKQLALLMLDLDRFKAVNDSFGHLVGDELLQQVATRITKKLRDVDTVARLGGDEFIVLLEDIAQTEDAARVAETIIADLSEPFCLAQSDSVQISVSIGISLYPQHGDTPELLMDNADAALYQAKDAGRGCYAYFSEDLTIAARKRIALETRLRGAIEHRELHVFYQPQVDIVTGRIVGAEALLRWQDPTEGLISPAYFIPIAEETGLIISIGEWVLRETCRQGQQWLDEGLPAITLAVNVSPQQFRRGDICALVATVLAETGFPATQLELEITETGLMENQANAEAILNNLRAQHIRLAIDDFGTGYSSLAYLKHFPLDVLKIDKSFIDDIPFQQDDMEIAATIIAMGHILGFKVLAEGVETQQQLAFLQEKSCNMYQGYLRSKPVPADEFAALLRVQQRSLSE